MELKQLRYFLGVCEHGSIAQAAREMHIAQPALSRQMTQLEELLGIVLFKRLPRGVALTRPGEELRARARELLAQAQALGGQLHIASKGLTGTLRIGMMPAYSWLPQLNRALAQMLEKAPGIQTSIETLHSAVLMERLRSHDVDVAIVSWRSPYDEAFEGVSAFKERMVVALPKAWPEASKRGTLRMRALCERPLLLFPRERSPQHFDTLMHAFARAGVKPKSLRITVADVPTAVGMVAAGFGYAIAPESYAQQWAGKVVFRPVQDLDIPLTLELVWRKHDPDPVLGQFLRLWRDADDAQDHALPFMGRTP